MAKHANSRRAPILTIFTPGYAAAEQVTSSTQRPGIGALIFGLFAEMCIEAIRLPNEIINTASVNEPLVGVSVFFLVLCVYILARHVVALLVPTHHH